MLDSNLAVCDRRAALENLYRSVQTVLASNAAVLVGLTFGLAVLRQVRHIQNGEVLYKLLGSSIPLAEKYSEYYIFKVKGQVISLMPASYIHTELISKGIRAMIEY